jgi:hypothetical protein
VCLNHPLRCAVLGERKIEFLEVPLSDADGEALGRSKCSLGKLVISEKLITLK